MTATKISLAWKKAELKMKSIVVTGKLFQRGMDKEEMSSLDRVLR